MYIAVVIACLVSTAPHCERYDAGIKYEYESECLTAMTNAALSIKGPYEAATIRCDRTYHSSKDYVASVITLKRAWRKPPKHFASIHKHL